MSTRAKSLKSQAGVLLIEGLIAILIFSLGILAIVGMQATAVKQASDAHYRSEASLLAEQLLGRMWADDRTSSALKAKFEPGGTGYTDWLAYVTEELPNGQADVIVFSDSTSGSDGTVTVTIKWAQPGDPTVNVLDTATYHKYITVAQIK